MTTHTWHALADITFAAAAAWGGFIDGDNRRGRMALAVAIAALAARLLG